MSDKPATPTVRGRTTEDVIREAADADDATMRALVLALRDRFDGRAARRTERAA